MQILESLRSEIKVISLEECSQILTGKAIKSSELVQIPDGEKPIPYIRIKDIQQGQAKKGSVWLSKNAVAAIDAESKLLAGDVLISKSGTIGKVGVISNWAVGSVATNGFFILRPNQDLLDPHFLMAYLESSECKTWLNDKARGATIRHLSKQLLDKLPVPLPSFQIQQNVAIHHREQDIDALTYLVQLLTHSEDDLIAAWIDTAAATLPPEIEAIDNPLDFGSLDSLAEVTSEISNSAVNGSDDNNLFKIWLLNFSDAVSHFRGINDIPKGPGLLSLLQGSTKALRESLSIIEKCFSNIDKVNINSIDKAYIDKAIKLNNRVLAWIERACSALLDIVKVVINTDNAILPLGKNAEIKIDIQNQSPLPLRNFLMESDPNWGNKQTTYLAEHSLISANLFGPILQNPGTSTLIISWSAETLSGKLVSAINAIELEFVEPNKDLIETDIGTSPYVCGNPIKPGSKDIFFGRDDLLAQIRRQIIHSGNVILLEGNRRSGKSSILYHLAKTDSIPGWFSVYCDLQGSEGSKDKVGVPTVEIFREMAENIAKRLFILVHDIPLPNGSFLPPGSDLDPHSLDLINSGIREDSPFTDFRNYIDIVLKMLGNFDLGLIMMLDEFDSIQQGIVTGVTSPQVPYNIRSLIQSFPRFCAILTGARILKEQREDHWSALYGLGTAYRVPSLLMDDARNLIIEPVKGRLTYSTESVERIFFLTSGQPYLIQCLCGRIFDIAARLKMRSVNLDLVNQSVDDFVQINTHFVDFWNYAGSDRKRFLLLLFHEESKGNVPLKFAVIHELLLHHGIDIRDETLFEDLDFLINLELIKYFKGSGGGHYSLAIPLMGFWIDIHKDFEAYKRKARNEMEILNE
jgi:type I restriction enzyme M protein